MLRGLGFVHSITNFIISLKGDLRVGHYGLRRRLLFWLEEYQQFQDRRAKDSPITAELKKLTKKHLLAHSILFQVEAALGL